MKISIERKRKEFWQSYQIFKCRFIVSINIVSLRVCHHTLRARRGAAPFSKPEKVSSYQSSISVKAVINHIMVCDITVFYPTLAPRLRLCGLRKFSLLARS